VWRSGRGPKEVRDGTGMCEVVPPPHVFPALAASCPLRDASDSRSRRKGANVCRPSSAEVAAGGPVASRRPDRDVALELVTTSPTELAHRVGSTTLRICCQWESKRRVLHPAVWWCDTNPSRTRAFATTPSSRASGERLLLRRTLTRMIGKTAGVCGRGQWEAIC